MSSESSNTVNPQDVLDKLMYDGTFDNLRSSLISLLKSNDELKSFILTSVEQSQVLRTTDLETKSKRQLMEELRHDLSYSVLERASIAAWKLMISSGGVGDEIKEKVDATYCELTGLPCLGCDCHGHGPTLKDSLLPGDNGSANSELTKGRVNIESVPQEEPQAVCNSSETESPMEKGGADLKGHGEDTRPAYCNGSVGDNSRKIQKEGNWNIWMGSAGTISDPLGTMFL